MSGEPDLTLVVLDDDGRAQLAFSAAAQPEKGPPAPAAPEKAAPEKAAPEKAAAEEGDRR
ncbi:MAG TPA: hypothetical protein VFE14_15975 [Micromonosporaceae bacterium]|jgi:hypothetical protein|nr:hypothetical protein [Micromonosporaceae bacterium]